jgi:hypothetical protein
MHRKPDTHDRMEHVLNPLHVYARLMPVLGIRRAWWAARVYEKAYVLVGPHHLFHST